jgi:hypothetical protein
MKTLTLDVRTPADAMADFAVAWNTDKPQKSARISFATPELLWRVLSQKRWELLKALCGAGPVSIREAARRAERDVKPVHGVRYSATYRRSPHSHGRWPHHFSIQSGQSRVPAACRLACHRTGPT